MTSWLVTGGAGYIGSHVARVFAERGIGVVVVDDLSSGHREFVDPGVPFVEGSILDGDLLGRTFAAHDVEGVIHIAGFKYAGESVKRPLHTLRQNVVGTMVLLEEMQRAGSERSCSPPARPCTGRPTSPWSPRTPPRTPSRPTVSRS